MQACSGWKKNFKIKYCTCSTQVQKNLVVGEQKNNFTDIEMENYGTESLNTIMRITYCIDTTVNKTVLGYSRFVEWKFIGYSPK